MNVDIFIRSYRNDLGWLKYCLQSIQKFAKGFNSIHIAFPEQDFGLISHLTAEEKHPVVDGCHGYLAQQITKINADKYCNGDYIMHVDSDCILTQEVTPDMFFEDGKPIMLRESDIDSPWRDIAVAALGWKDDFEYMRRLPIVYPRWIYKHFREWMQKQHGIPVDAWITMQPNNQFSEFQTLGQWAFRYCNNDFAWKHPSEVPVYLKQWWSYGGVESAENEIKSILS